MPLNRACSLDAFEANIAAEIRAGKSRAQAVAIARQTLEDACKGEGKPVPKSVKKAAQRHSNAYIKQSKRTRDFLEEVFQRARAVMNPRDFAVVFQAARGSAGGKATARNRLSAMESHTIEKRALSAMSAQELKSMAHTLNVSFAKAKKTGRSFDSIVSKARGVAAEMKRRGMKPDGSVFVTLGDKRPVKKGFLNGEPEGGFHAHGLDRRNSKTSDDGAHIHAWQLPGTNELVISMEDGAHAHEIMDNGDSTVTDGSHSHRVLMPNGALLETKLGGAHPHELMVETSGFGGGHVHELVLPDGTSLKSLTSGEFVRSLGEPPPPTVAPPASAISRAHRDLMQRERDEMMNASLPSAPSLEEAVLMTAKGEAPTPPLLVFEVLEADDNEIHYGPWAAKNVLGAEVGDLLDVRPDGEAVCVSQKTMPDTEAEIVEKSDYWTLVKKHTTPVPFVGPEDAKLMFIAAAPNELELARREAIVGEDALTFADVYLGPLGLAKSDVALGFVMPTLPYSEMSPEICDPWKDHLVTALKSYRSAKVVALGKSARTVLQKAGIEHWSLPHPSAVRKKGDSGEVSRKLKHIAKALDVSLGDVQDLSQPKGAPSFVQHQAAKLTDAISEMRKTGNMPVRVSKSAEEKQIVYGVVLDPYDVDLQEEWVPPAEIESTAHGFLKKSRVIGFEHVERADAQIVESWVEPYPSKADYEAALANQPHKAFVRKFGDDEIHSGAWVAGVQLGDQEWADYQAGKLNAFSVGGFSFKTKVSTAAMPKVEFVELIEAPV